MNTSTRLMQGSPRRRRTAVLVALSLTCLAALPAGAVSGPLNENTYWLGNSFPGGNRNVDKWVQLDFQDIFVFPDGRVVGNAGWDEAGRTMGFYKDGDAIGEVDDYTAMTGGRAITADESYIFALRKERKSKQDDSWWYGVARYTLDGKLAGWSGGEGREGNLLFLYSEDAGGRALTGVAVRNGELFLSDPNTKKIRVYNATTMSPLREFSLNPGSDTPLKTVFDDDGRLWICQRVDDDTYRIRAYSVQGAYQNHEITTVDVPTALTVDKVGRLLVADNGSRQQVLKYDISGGTPELEETLGVLGGVYSGANAGRVAPDRFCGLAGVGVDADGNVYVASNGGPSFGTSGNRTFGAKLQAFSSAGTCLWTLEGLEFVDSADIDPGQEHHIHSKDSRYEIYNYTEAPTGTGPDHAGWIHAAWTIDWLEYPNDPRLHIRQEGVRIVRLSDGTKLQACQTDSHLCVYRFDGEIAVPAAAFARKATSSDEWPPNNPYTSQAWMWVDQNDDGDFQASEFDTIADANISVMRAWFFDDEGAVWIGEQETGTIHRYPLGTGSEPMYSRSSRILTQAPSDITRVRSLYYDPCGDTMYMGTYSNDNPYEFWGPMSREIRRFDQWSTAKTARWTIAIPYMYTGNRSQDIYPRALDVEGDYVFVAYDLGSDDERHRGEVVVFRASDGTEVGSLWLGEEVGSSGGALDHGACVHVHQLANGTYVVLIEEDEFAKIVYYQWHDDGQVNLCDPPGV